MSDRFVISSEGAWQVGPTLSSVGGGGGGTISIDTSGFSAGDVVYIDSGGDLQLAACNDLATAEAVGIVSSEADTVIVAGEARGFAGLTPGGRYYLSATPGEVTLTPPTTVDYVVVKTGVAISATSFLVDIDEVAIL